MHPELNGVLGGITEAVGGGGSGCNETWPTPLSVLQIRMMPEAACPADE